VKNWKVRAFCICVFLFGIMSALGFLWVQSNRIPTRWFEFDSLKQADSLKEQHLFSATPEAIFATDIPLPKIERVELKAKFKEPDLLASDHDHLDYVLKITVDKLDKKHVPEKYSLSRLEEVTYSITYEIVFTAANGFDIYRTSAIKGEVQSGRTNTYQDIATDPIPFSIAMITKSFRPQITIIKCLSCDFR